jgi:hypothetical protein
MLRERQIFAGIGDEYVGAPVAFLYCRGHALAHCPSPNRDWSIYSRARSAIAGVEPPKVGAMLPEFTKI